MNDPKMLYFAELIFADARNLVKNRKFGKHLIRWKIQGQQIFLFDRGSAIYIELTSQTIISPPVQRGLEIPSLSGESVNGTNSQEPTLN